MSKIKVVLNNLDNDENTQEYDGEIYKGFGIVYWESEAYFAIELDTCKIIARYNGKTCEEVKSKIDSEGL